MASRVARAHGMSAGAAPPPLRAGNIIYPNDTIRRRLQFNSGGESYVEAARSLLRDGGLPRLYKGCLLYNLKVAPAAAMQFATYYGLKELMTR
eukprot:7167479-Prymnesium_polylepis.1